MRIFDVCKKKKKIMWQLVILSLVGFASAGGPPSGGDLNYGKFS